MHRLQRGSALIIAIVVLLVITVIGVGMLSFASREVSGAYADVHDRALSACAEAARVQLMSQFHALGFQPSALQALNVSLGNTSGGAQVAAVGGHYDTPIGSVVLDQVTYLPETAFGPTTAARDLSNISSLVGQGGRPMKVTVHCQDAAGRQLEVEFGIRFGL